MSKYPKTPTLVVRANHNPFLFEGLLGECESLGWDVINLMYCSNYLPSDLTPVGAVIQRPPEDSSVDQLRDRGVPIVSITELDEDRFDEKDGRVYEDRHAAGWLAADAFIERGFKNLGYVCFGPPTDPLFIGFRDRAETAQGTAVDVCSLGAFPGEGDPTTRYAYEVTNISTWLKTAPAPLGVLSFNHRMGIRIITACDLAGLKVPEQVAIICRDNMEGICETAPVPLSAIDINLAELGRQAVRLVKRLSEGAALPPEPIRIPVKGFVERRSTDILAVPDTRVATAMRFMWDHLNWPLRVDDVAGELNVSRNTLERAFRRTLGRGVNSELRRKRLERCKELLHNTKMPLSEIAKAIGMNSRNYLHRAFKNAFGMTPQQYRNSGTSKTKGQDE